MKKQAAIRLFGSQAALARELELTRQAIQKWPETVPYRWQFVIQARTWGKLKASKAARKWLERLA